MNDNKLSYTISWSQPYPYSNEFVWVDLTATFEEEVEQKLDAGEFSQAVEIINIIRSKK